MGVVRYLVPCVLALGCGRIEFDPLALEVELAPLYPVNGAGWNDYVLRDWTATELSSPDLACPYAETVSRRFYDDCIHGGEKRRVFVAGLASCDGLRYGDELNAFDWTCVPEDGGVAFVSRGLKPERRLGELVVETAWKDNSFEVRRDGELIAETAPAAWWSNPVLPLPPNDGGALVILDEPNAIYTLAAATRTAGYHIGANGIAVVTLGDAVLSFGTGAANCDPTTNGPVLTNRIARCTLSSGDRGRLWIEGTFDGNGMGDHAVVLTVAFQSRLHHVTAIGHRGTGVRLNVCYGMLAEHVVAANNLGRGFHDHYSEYATYRDLVAASNLDDGIYMYDGGPWRVSNVRTFNNSNAGFDFAFNALGTVANVLATGNAGDGMAWTQIDLPQSTVHRVVAINNGNAGVRVRNFQEDTLSHVVAINNNLSGLLVDTGYLLDITTLLLANNGRYGVEVNAVDAGSFGGPMLLGNNQLGDCAVTGGTSPGIDATCQSGAQLRTNIDGRSSFVGPEPGTTAESSITNWRFAEPWTVLGQSSSAYDFAARGRCAGTCKLWSFALADTDIVMRNAAQLGVPMPEPLVAGDVCPSGVHGDRVQRAITTECDFNDTWRGSCNRTFLLDAIELDYDYIGNDDGLCESAEACVYAPSFGLDQGRGDLVGPCTFVDGAVTGVTMYGYAE